MEKLCSTEVINGDVRLKLPVGFRFRPTDEELIVHYLARKVLALPLPAPAVTELDVFRSEPRDLPGDLKERRHFFSRISRGTRNLHGSDVSRRVVASGSGYWRPIGREKHIVSGSDSNRPIGVRKSFVFREKIRGGSGIVKKQWILHELRLVGLRKRPLCSTLSDNLAKPRSEEQGEWAVYRVFQKKRKTKRHRCKELVCSNLATEMEFVGEEDTGTRWSDPPPPSSPCSSLTMEHDSPFGVPLVDEDEITS